MAATDCNEDLQVLAGFVWIKCLLHTTVGEDQIVISCFGEKITSASAGIIAAESALKP